MEKPLFQKQDSCKKAIEGVLEKSSNFIDKQTPDRKLHPAALECQALQAPVYCTLEGASPFLHDSRTHTTDDGLIHDSEDSSSGSVVQVLRVCNRYEYCDLQRLHGFWWIERDGRPVTRKASLPTLLTPAGAPFLSLSLSLARALSLFRCRCSLAKP